MSPGEQLAKHRDAVKFRLGEQKMAFRELWTPAETEEEQRLLEEAAVEAITDAVQRHDYVRVDSLAADLRRQFGGELLEVSHEAAPVATPEKEPLSALEQELHAMLDPHWDKAVQSLRPSVSYFEDLVAHADMRRFDPKRYDETAPPADQWEVERVVADKIKKSLDWPDRSMAFASDLKRLVGKEKFDEMVPAEDIERIWQLFVGSFIGKNVRRVVSALIYAEALFPEKIREKLNDPQWKKLRDCVRDFMEYGVSRHARVLPLKALRILTLEGEQAQKLSQEDWRILKNEMEDSIRHRDFSWAFAMANLVRNVGVEEK
jgi:hypothetical protein